MSSYLWDNTLDEVRLYAFGGRFGDDSYYPAPEYTLFRVPVPTSHQRHGYEPRDDDPSIDHLRVFDHDGSHGELPYLGCLPGRDVYECDKLEDKGFRWKLTRHDLRPQLRAHVDRVRKKRWRREQGVFAVTTKVNVIMLRLEATRYRFYADPLALEPDHAGRKTVHPGEIVYVVLYRDPDRGFAVSRIWPLFRFYDALGESVSLAFRAGRLFGWLLRVIRRTSRAK